MFEEYLGDAVYASFDGYHIWLTTKDGNNQRIALEPSVFHALVDYQGSLKHRIAEASNPLDLPGGNL